MLSDGYHDVDPHKIVTVETSLEMFARPPRRAASAPPSRASSDWRTSAPRNTSTSIAP